MLDMGDLAARVGVSVGSHSGQGLATWGAGTRSVAGVFVWRARGFRGAGLRVVAVFGSVAIA
jgi:hypothetical protein